jgi:hypothetical protein
MRKAILVLSVIMLATAGAWADFGNGNTSVTVTYLYPTLDVRFDMTASTTGAATPGYNSNDIYTFLVQLYQTSAGTTTTSTYYRFTNTRTGATPTTFNFSHVLTAPFADTWDYWTRFAAVNPNQCSVTTGGVFCYWSISNVNTGQVVVDPLQPTSTPSVGGNGEPVPTLSMPALLLLGGILMGVGVLLLRRR